MINIAKCSPTDFSIRGTEICGAVASISLTHKAITIWEFFLHLPHISGADIPGARANVPGGPGVDTDVPGGPVGGADIPGGPGAEAVIPGGPGVGAVVPGGPGVGAVVPGGPEGGAVVHG